MANMSNKVKLKKYKDFLQEQDKKETIKKIKDDIEIYGHFHIDTFAELVCNIEDCIELRQAAEDYNNKINELRDDFEIVAKNYGFMSLRRRENGGAFS